MKENKKEIVEKIKDWNKEEHGNSLHRNKVFYKTDGLLPYETRIGLLYVTPNQELMREIERRINCNEIDLLALINYLESKKHKKYV
jgi:hypothetical protein